jgi:hypothetical protein
MTSELYNQKRQAYLAHKMTHDEFYLWVASVINWNWRLASMGYSVEWWAEKYEQDEHLNNVPLKWFDNYYLVFLNSARGKGVWVAPADCVCVLKAIIRQKMLSRRTP